MRVWVTCGLVTAAVVLAVLFLTDRPDADADGSVGPSAPAPLTEQDVRTYVLLRPDEDRILREIAGEALSRGPAEHEALGEKARARVDALLQGQHLTREDWRAIRTRVERVVNLIRAEEEFPAARPGIEQRLDMKKEHLKTLGASDPRRPQVEQEIRDAEMLLENGPMKASEQDKAVARRFWEPLQKWATTIGPR
jgi:hypothetical protein